MALIIAWPSISTFKLNASKSLSRSSLGGEHNTRLHMQMHEIIYINCTGITLDAYA